MNGEQSLSSEDFCTSVYNNVKFSIHDGGLLFCLQNNVIIALVLIVGFILIQPRAFTKWIQIIRERKKRFTKEEMTEIEKPRTSVFQIKLSEMKPKTSLDDYVSYREEILTTLQKLWKPIISKASTFETEAGPLGLNYIRFLQITLCLLIIYSVINSVVVLPLTLIKFKSFQVANWFTAMTLMNVNFYEKSSWLYVFLPTIYHVLLICGVIYWNTMICEGKNNVSLVTVSVEGISSSASLMDVAEFFKNKYGDEIEVVDFCPGYNISRLMEIKREKAIALCGFNLFKYYSRFETDKNTIYVKKNWYGCRMLAKYGQKYSNYIFISDAFQYYSENVNLSSQILKKEIYNALAKPLDLAFITFKTPAMMHRFYIDSKILNVLPQEKDPTQRILTKPNLTVHHTSETDNIIWKNITDSSKKYFIFILTNLVFVVVLIFFTSPSVLILYTPLKKVYYNEENIHDFTFSQNFLYFFVPPLITFTIAMIIEAAVTISINQRHYTSWSEKENKNFILKYIYYFLTIFIIGNIGFSSIALFILYLDKDGVSVIKSQIKCVGMPQLSSYFIGFLTTSFLIGEVLELIQISNNAQKFIYKLMAKDPAEEIYMENKYKIEPSWASDYAWTCLILTIPLAYAVTSCFALYIATAGMALRLYTAKYKFLYVYTFKPRYFVKNNVTTIVSHIVACTGIFIHLGVFITLISRLGMKNIKSITSLLFTYAFITAYIIYSLYAVRRHYIECKIPIFLRHGFFTGVKKDRYIPPAVTNIQFSTTPFR